MKKQQAIICDLDGTLYDARGRQEKYLLSGKKDFDAFHQAASNDTPNWWCAQIVMALRARGYKPLFVSGRDDTYKNEAHSWLRTHLGIVRYEYELFMRPAGDFMADTVLKFRIFSEHIQPHYDVLFCIDDRKRVVQMWRQLGIPCLQCAEGDF